MNRHYFNFIKLILMTLCLISPALCSAQEETAPPPTQNEVTAFDPYEDDVAEKPKAYDFWSEFMNMLSMLSLVIFALLALAWIMRRVMNQRMETINQTSVIRILERRTVSPKSTFYLLEVLGRGYLVAETAAGVHRIADLPEDADLSMDVNPVRKSFSETLDQKRGD